MIGVYMDDLEFKKEEDKVKYNSWSKEQIYRAYLSERETRVSLNIQINKTNRRLAEIKFLAGVNSECR